MTHLRRRLHEFLGHEVTFARIAWPWGPRQLHTCSCGQDWPA